VVPSPLDLGPATWDRLVTWAHQGKTVLITGAAGAWDRVGLATSKAPLAGVETLFIGPDPWEVSFRRALDHFEPGTLYDRLEGPGPSSLEVRDLSWGQGRLLVCPLPVEACDDDGVIEAVYRWALERSPALPQVFKVDQDPGPRLGVYAQPYALATRYTLVNEGAAARVRLTDAATGVRFEAEVPDGRAVIVWVGPGEGLSATGQVRRLP